ncbi:hypothetical protein CHARACLAT_006385 [Characodon lateralis]|uniref:Uncharacterized protein n=1 Tax=Characodon lateralis TaxID=208331 RepID=A0ABU7E1F4_9TELE|nr:hypothetical protein [Characodon lateralis]
MCVMKIGNLKKSKPLLIKNKLLTLKRSHWPNTIESTTTENMEKPHNAPRGRPLQHDSNRTFCPLFTEDAPMRLCGQEYREEEEEELSHKHFETPERKHNVKT